jgi:hypothetical protein
MVLEQTGIHIFVCMKVFINVNLFNMESNYNGLRYMGGYAEQNAFVTPYPSEKLQILFSLFYLSTAFVFVMLVGLRMHNYYSSQTSMKQHDDDLECQTCKSRDLEMMEQEDQHKRPRQQQHEQAPDLHTILTSPELRSQVSDESVRSMYVSNFELEEPLIWMNPLKSRFRNA